MLIKCNNSCQIPHWMNIRYFLSGVDGQEATRLNGYN